MLEESEDLRKIGLLGEPGDHRRTVDVWGDTGGLWDAEGPQRKTGMLEEQIIMGCGWGRSKEEHCGMLGVPEGPGGFSDAW